jgi:predicted DNA-binding transcriptional regulator YafY
MKHKKYLERYRRIQDLIYAEKTGSADEFAYRIGISRRMLFNYLDDLKDMGLEIEYCRKRKTYYCLSPKLDFMLLI